MHLITHTLGRTALDEASAHDRDLYLYNTQHSQETDINVRGGVRTHSTSKRTASDVHLRPGGQWDRQITIYGLQICL